MRILMIPLLLAALPVMAVNPDKLFVIVHTTDRVVVDYTCSSFLSESDPAAPVFKSVVQSQGSFTWHATGGKAPYRLIRDIDSNGGDCVTVMDADGNTATGCGSIKEVHVRRNVNCESGPDSSRFTFIAPHAFQAQPILRSVGHPVPGPVPGPTPVDPKNPGRLPPPPPPPHTPGPDPKKPDHVTPVRDPSPGVHPPDRPHKNPSRQPVRSIDPPSGTSSHGRTMPSRNSNSTGGGTHGHGSSHPSGRGSSGWIHRSSPAPH